METIDDLIEILGNTPIRPPRVKVALRTDRPNPFWEQNIVLPTESELSEVESRLGVKFPKSYRAFLLRIGGGELDVRNGNGDCLTHLEFFAPDQIIEYTCDSDTWGSWLPEMIFLAKTDAALWFFDPINKLKRGAWSIFVVSRSGAYFEDSKFIAKDIISIFERALNGETLDKG